MEEHSLLSRTLKTGLLVLAGLSLALPALSQEAADQFPAVPKNHWVYEALLRMKNEGVLVGYPEGLFRGGRPASRYELAGAVNQAYVRLKSMLGALEDQVTALRRILESAQDVATRAEVDDLRAELEALKGDLADMRKWKDDLDALQRMADVFGGELRKWGVDVPAMKKGLADLSSRVGSLERQKPAVGVHGDVSLIMLGGQSADELFGLTADARPTGVGRRDDTGMARGPTMGNTTVAGNLAGPDSITFGNRSQIQADSPFAEPNAGIYSQNFGISFDASLWGQTFTAELGRVGYKTAPMFFMREDGTPYFNGERWDDGLWYFDGGILKFNWGAATLGVFGGKQSSAMESDGLGSVGVWPMTAGPRDVFGNGDLSIDQHLGFNLDIGLGKGSDVMLNYMFLDSKDVVADPVSGDSVNRVVVWGGELNYSLARNVQLNAGYSQSDEMYNTTSVLDENNFAWWAQARVNVGKAALDLGFRHIEPYFGAPGDWGRIGFLWNPVDHEGFYGDVSFPIGGKLRAKVGGFFYQGLEGVVLPEEFVAKGINAMLDFRMNPSWGLNLGWEFAKFDFVTNQPEVMWWRVGLNYGTGDGSSLRFLYEISNYDADTVGVLGGFNTNRRGGLLTAQWTKKF